jgi:hypothetical protein
MKMKMIKGIVICAILVIVSILVSYTQTAKKGEPTADREADIKRGKYLVEEVDNKSVMRCTSHCIQLSTERRADTLDNESLKRGLKLVTHGERAYV